MEGILSSPEEAEEAFYRAFERADIAEMMTVWAEQDGIVCVHPDGGRQAGVAQVRESWRRIFASGQRLKFRLSGNRAYAAGNVCVHSVFEHVTLSGEQRPATQLTATNIYLLTERGWRLFLHHASPLVASQSPGETPPSTLH